MASPLSLRYFFTRAAHLSLSKTLTAGSHKLDLGVKVDPPVLIEVKRSQLPLGSFLFLMNDDAIFWPTLPPRVPTPYAIALYFMSRELPVDSVLVDMRSGGAADVDITFYHLRYDITTTPTRGGTFDITENLFKIGEVAIEAWEPLGGNVRFAAVAPFTQSWPVYIKVCNSSGFPFGVTILPYMPTSRATVELDIPVYPGTCIWTKTYTYSPYTWRPHWLAYVVVAIVGGLASGTLGRIEFYGVVHNATPV